MLEFINDIQTQFAALPAGVSLWVMWMMAVFFAATPFSLKHRSARFALLTFFGFTFLGAGIAVWLTGSIHWIALVHLIFWPPLLFYLMKHEISGPNFEVKSIYGIWIVLLTITIIISLIFDVRDTAMLLQGSK